jgi:hypothetical protein
VDSLQQQIQLEEERLERQQQRLRLLQAQLKRDRVVRPRDEDEDDLDSGGHGAAVRMGQDVEVGEGEVVREAVSMGGNVIVRGEVEQDAVAIGGDVLVGSQGRVGGSAVSIGGELEIEPGGIVEGDRVEVGNLGPGFLGGGGFLNQDRGHEGARRGFKLLRGLMTLLVLVFVGWLVMLLFGDRLSAMADVALHSFGRSLLAGLLVLVLWLPTVVLFAITVIGIPVAIILVVAVPLAIFVGYFIGALAFGRRIAAGINLERNGAVGHLFVGLVALGALTIIGTLFEMVRFLGPLALAFCILGGTLMCFAALTGLGAMTMTQFGNLKFRRRGASDPSGGAPGTPGAAGGPGGSGGIPPGELAPSQSAP